METIIESKKKLLLRALGFRFRLPLKRIQFLRSLDVINVFVKFCKILDNFWCQLGPQKGSQTEKVGPTDTTETQQTHSNQ